MPDLVTPNDIGPGQIFVGRDNDNLGQVIFAHRTETDEIFVSITMAANTAREVAQRFLDAADLAEGKAGRA